MAGFGQTPSDWAERYAKNMAYASELYEDVIGAVDLVLPGTFMTQLGGMCLAIESPIDGGWVWIVDYEDNLPWDRQYLTGWRVALFLGEDDGERQPIREAQTTDRTLGGLMVSLQDVLHGVWARP